VFVLAILFSAVYTWLISGHLHPLCLLVPFLGAFGGLYVTDSYPADYLWVAALILLLPAIRVHKDGKYHATWGDRADGRRVRSIPPMALVEPYIMDRRTASGNLFAESIEISAADDYIHRRRREGMAGLGITHVLIRHGNIVIDAVVNISYGDQSNNWQLWLERAEAMLVGS
jgi:hypothetical protein